MGAKHRWGRTACLVALVCAVAYGCGESAEIAGKAQARAALDAVRAHRGLATRLRRLPLRLSAGRYALERRAGARLRASVSAAAGALRIEGSGGAWIELEPLARRDVAAVVDGNAVVFPSAEPQTDVLVVLDHGRVEDQRVQWSAEAPATARYRVKTGAEIADVTVQGGGLEVRDRRKRVVLRALPPFAVDARGRRFPVALQITEENGARVLETEIDRQGAVYPIVVDPEWQAGPGWPDSAIVASHSIVLRHDSVVYGDAAALAAVPAGDHLLEGVELNVGQDATIVGNLRADSIKLHQGALLNGDAWYNDLTNDGGAVTGDTHTPLAMPLAVTVPAFPGFQHGAADVSAQPNAYNELAEGHYRDVAVDAGAELWLDAGVTTVRHVTLGDGVLLHCLAGNFVGCELRLTGRLAAGAGAQLDQEISLFIKARDDGASTPAAAIAASAFGYGRIFAPNGTIRSGAELTGSLVARDVDLDAGGHAEANLFALAPDCAGYCAALVGAACANGPTQAACEADCNDKLTNGYCQYQERRLVDCAAFYSYSASCDGSGGPVFADCANETGYLSTCQSVCVGVADSNPCTEDICDCTPLECGAGSIQHLPRTGESCANSTVCDGDETCDANAQCQSGTPPPLDDGNPCTADACDAVLGVSHTPINAGASCSDNNACNGAEVCDGAGVCLPGTPVNADDGNPCTDDACDPATGSVSHTARPVGSACSDGDACNGLETCSAAAVCTASDPLHTDDGNPCTIDSCVPHSGAVHTPAANGTSCSDGDACNGAEICSAGVCQSGTPVAIDDSQACTVDTCDPASGNVTHSACSPIDPTVPTTVFDAMKFLIDTGVQHGVGAGAIQPLRAGVVRGRALTTAGQPLPGVEITAVPIDPADQGYGATATQGNGWFDLMVNAGGRITVRYRKAGYPVVQRTVDTDAGDYALVDDVVMTPYDAHVESVYLGAASAPQAVSGSTITDAAGTRTPLVIFAAGTEATMVLPDESVAPLSTLSVRATEFTVGPRGQLAMPADLPSTTAYTYALELSVDQALAAGAERVEFSKPVMLYLDNFHGFAVKSLVPTGYYDRDRDTWIPERDGITVKILGLDASGRALLDFDGDGVAEGAEALSGLLVTDAERVMLGARYPAGKTLWRVPLDHFTAHDLNMPFGGQNSCAPGEKGCELPNPSASNDKDKPTCTSGSIIECENQTVGQVFPVTGTPLFLSYWSDRAPGRIKSFEALLPTVGPHALPSAIEAVRTDVQVAGRRLPDDAESTATWHFCAGGMTAECQTNSFFKQGWDGKDAWGRYVQGVQRAIVRTGYVKLQQVSCPTPFIVIGGSAGGGGGGGTSYALGGAGAYKSFAAYPAEDRGSTMIEGGSCPDGSWFGSFYLTVWKRWKLGLGAWNSQPEGLGGLNLSVHHGYSAWARTMWLGDGRRRGADETPVIETVAGGAPYPGAADGSEARKVHLSGPVGVAAAPDGSFYLAEPNKARIRKVGLDGIIHTIAGDVGTGFSGDGGPATAAMLFYPNDVARGPDGSLYIADTGNRRIRRIAPSGIISTFAGNGGFASSGDGGPATSASLHPTRLAVGPDGSVFAIDDLRVRRIAPGGIISTVAGDGDGPAAGGQPAVGAFLDTPQAITTDAGGRLYLATGNYTPRVLRIEPNGLFSVVAGTGSIGSIGDGGPAVDAHLANPRGLAFDKDGNLYIVVGDVDTSFHSAPGVRRVTPDGFIDTVFGAPWDPLCYDTYCGEKGPAHAAHFVFLESIARAADGSMLLVEFNEGRVFRVHAPLPAPSLASTTIPDESGALLYLFDPQERHIETRDALLGTLRYSFQYDATGRLHTVTDGDGMVTTIAHDAAGNPTLITAPHGQQTTLSVNGDGLVDTITDPLGHAFHLTYGSAGGLLSSLTDRNGNVKTYDYNNANGLLAKAWSPPAVGGFKELSRIEYADNKSRTVTNKTALGRLSLYDVDRKTDRLDTTTTAPDGVVVTRSERDDGVEVTTYPGGTTLEVEKKADPRWGMAAPIVASAKLTTGGKTLTTSHSRTVALADPHDPLSVQTLDDEVTVNGRTVHRHISLAASPATLTATSAGNRSSVTTIDAAGRPILVTPGSSSLAATALAYYDASDPAKKGLLKAVTRGAGANARHYEFFYDTAGNLDHVDGPLGKTVTFHYDAAGRLTQKTFPSQDSVHFKYDANDNLIELVPPGGDPQANASEHHVFSHNGIDLLTGYTPPVVNNMQGATLVEYDDDHATAKVTHPGNIVVTPSYAATSGRLDALNLPNNETIAYTYDTAGRVATLASSRDGETQTLGYAGSLLSSVTWTGTVGGNTGASVAFAYDNDLRVTSETVSDGTTQHAASYLYEDSDGLLTKAGDLTLTLDAPTGALHATSIGVVSDTLGRNEFGELTSYLAKASNIPFYAVDYDRDALGRVTRKTETVLGTTTVAEYLYDPAGRLSDVYQGTAPCTPEAPCDWVEHDEYDPNGNRTTGGDPATPSTGSYDQQDRIQSYAGVSYTHTSNGEVASKGSTTFDWDALGQLRKVDQSASNGPVIEYLYDSQGHRIAKKYNGNIVAKWLYDGGPTPVAELYATGQVKLRFVYGTRPHVPDYMVVLATGATYRFVTDQLGSVRLVVKTSDGTVAQRIDYDAWGNATVVSGPADFQPFGFAGGLSDADTGLVHFGARDYDPEIGRWLRKDPLLFDGGDTNLYAYAANKPVDLIDPSGLAWDFGFGAFEVGVHNRADGLLMMSNDATAAAGERLMAKGACQMSVGLGAVGATATLAVSAAGMLGPSANAARAGSGLGRLASGGGQKFEIIDGVRRAKAAAELGIQTIAVEVQIGGRTVATGEVAVSELLSSSKSVIDLSSPAQMERWLSIFNGMRNGDKLPPIIITPGSNGIPIPSVGFRF